MCEVQRAPWMDISSDEEMLFIPIQHDSDGDIVGIPTIKEQEENPDDIPEEVEPDVINEMPHEEDVKDVPSKKPQSKKKKSTKKSVPPRKKSKAPVKDKDLLLMEKLIKENEKAPPIPRKPAVQAPPPKEDTNLKELRAKLRAKINGRGESGNNAARTITILPPKQQSSSKNQAPEMPSLPPRIGYLQAKPVSSKKTPGADVKALHMFRKYEPYISRGEITVDKALELASAGIDPDDTVYAKVAGIDVGISEIAVEKIEKYTDLLKAETDLLHGTDPEATEKLMNVRQQLKSTQPGIMKEMVEWFMNETVYGNTMAKISEFDKKNLSRNEEIPRKWKRMCRQFYEKYNKKVIPRDQIVATQTHSVEEMYYEKVLKEWMGDSVSRYILDLDKEGIFETFKQPFVMVAIQKSEIDFFPRAEFMIPLDQVMAHKLLPSNIEIVGPAGTKPLVYVIFWSISFEFSRMGLYYRSEGDAPYGCVWMTYNRLDPMVDLVPMHEEIPPLVVMSPSETADLLSRINGEFSPESDLATALAESVRDRMESSSTDSDIEMDKFETTFDTDEARKTKVAIRNKAGELMAEMTFIANEHGGNDAHFHFLESTNKEYRYRIVKAFNKANRKRCCVE